MSAVDPALAVVREWIEKAEDDLKAAQLILKAGEGLTGTTAFHAQQCVEKYLKAYLTLRNLAFPKTHDLEKLISLLPAHARPIVSVAEQARLTEYAVAPRYPGWAEVSQVEARRAVALARRVRKHVRSLLPKDALQRGGS